MGEFVASCAIHLRRWRLRCWRWRRRLVLKAAEPGHDRLLQQEHDRGCKYEPRDPQRHDEVQLADLALPVDSPGHFRLQNQRRLSVNVIKQSIAAQNGVVDGSDVNVALSGQVLPRVRKIIRQFLSVDPVNGEGKVGGLFQSLQVAPAFEIARGKHEAANGSLCVWRYDRTTIRPAGALQEAATLR